MRKLLETSNSDFLKTLEKFARKKTFAENEVIFSEGEQAGFLPIVITGKIKMVKFPEPGKEVIISVFGDGEMFAVPPVFDGESYPSTAIAMENTELFLLERPDFLNLLSKSSEFSFAVIGWMCEMLREKSGIIQNLATASPEQRVGSILLRLAEKFEIENDKFRVTLRRQDIAEMAGLTTETTIRAVRRLAEKNLIKIERGKIVLDTLTPLRRFLH